MKKENKKLAQQRRAAEKAKKERNHKLKIAGSVMAAVVLILALIFVVGNADSTQVVKNGDVVNIDYTGYLDGEAFSGGSTNGAGTNLEIGSGSYIAGFEEGIIGHKVGETFDLNLQFPETYHNSEFAGKDVVFTVTINAIVE